MEEIIESRDRNFLWARGALERRPYLAQGAVPLRRIARWFTGRTVDDTSVLEALTGHSYIPIAWRGHYAAICAGYGFQLFVTWLENGQEFETAIEPDFLLGD